MFMFMKFCILLIAVFLVLGTVAACSSLQVLNAITPGSTYQKVANLAYGTDPRQKLDVYPSPPVASCHPHADSHPAPHVGTESVWSPQQITDHCLHVAAIASHGHFARRPPILHRSRDGASPAFVRSEINSRSNSAIVAKLPMRFAVFCYH
jgi:hypothetical protein